MLPFLIIGFSLASSSTSISVATGFQRALKILKQKLRWNQNFKFLLDFSAQIFQSECHTCRSTVAATSCSGVQREQRVRERWRWGRWRRRWWRRCPTLRQLLRILRLRRRSVCQRCPGLPCSEEGRRVEEILRELKEKEKGGGWNGENAEYGGSMERRKGCCQKIKEKRNKMK